MSTRNKPRTGAPIELTDKVRWSSHERVVARVASAWEGEVGRTMHMNSVSRRGALARYRQSIKPTLKVPVSPPLPAGRFVGVFSQPKGSFDKWRARGVNVLIASEPEARADGTPGVPQLDWRQAARNAGLPYYDRPSALGPEEDAKDPWLLGFLLDDEPDRRILLQNINAAKKEADPVKRAAYLRANADYVAGYEAVAARCRATGRPALGNFSGPDVTGGYPWYAGDGQKPLLPSCAELAMDWYVKTKDLARYPNSLVGLAVDLLVKWNAEIGQPAKPFWLFLECSSQNISKTGGPPSDADVDEQVAIGLARNVKGVIWFPQSFGPFRYDGLTARQAAKVEAVSKQLAGPVVVTPPEPVDPTVALGERIANVEAAVVGLVKAGAAAEKAAGEARGLALQSQAVIAALRAALVAPAPAPAAARRTVRRGKARVTR